MVNSAERHYPLGNTRLTQKYAKHIDRILKVLGEESAMVNDGSLVVDFVSYGRKGVLSHPERLEELERLLGRPVDLHEPIVKAGAWINKQEVEARRAKKEK